jgi:hypothetical protein
MPAQSPKNNVIPMYSHQGPSQVATSVYVYTSSDTISSEKDDAMTDVTREEIDAKLEASEARRETGMVRLESKLDAVLSKLENVADNARDAKEEARLAKVAASNIKWNFGFTVLAGIGALIAVMLTMWTVSYQITDTVRQSVIQQPAQTLPQ